MFKPGDKIISPNGNPATVTDISEIPGKDGEVFIYFTIDRDGREAGGLASKCSRNLAAELRESLIKHRLPDYDGLS